jgi:hypothetical protein
MLHAQSIIHENEKKIAQEISFHFVLSIIMETKWNGLQKFYDPKHTSATASCFELYSLKKLHRGIHRKLT